MEPYAEDVEKCANLEHQTIHLKIREFSKTDSETTPIFHHDIGEAKGFSLYLYHDGHYEGMKGCVSMDLHDFNKGPGRNVGVCLISIKDANNNFKFPRSFSFDNKGICFGHPLVTICYIARSMLLEDAEEFLPNDTLTLQIDIYFEKNVRNVQTDDLTGNCFEYDLPQGIEKYYYLMLDSKLGKRLCEESEYFKRFVEHPLSEKANKRMELTLKEHAFFPYIRSMIFGIKNINFHSIRLIIETYIVADRYLITIVSETCLLFLRLCLSDYDDDFLKELADEYERMNSPRLAECLRKKPEDSESEKFWEISDKTEWNYENRYGDLRFFKIDKKIHTSNQVNEKKEEVKEKEEKDLSVLFYLMLDSRLGKRLCEESEYFKRFAEHPLTENKKCMELTELEEFYFSIYIRRMIFGVTNIVFNSIRFIIETYIIADRYLITIVSETCLLFLRLCLSDYDDDVLSELANECERTACRKLGECLRKKNSKSEKFWESRGKTEWSYDNRYGYLRFFKIDEKIHISNDVNENKEEEEEEEKEEECCKSAKMKRRYIHCGEENDLCIEKNSEYVKRVSEEKNEFDFFIYS